ncbi:MAG: translation elongation factor [Deltaproteobacteria bacterium]|nr:translation elongation factor [Deltaproteobacteria bacterium]
MKDVAAADTRNFALVGHSTDGKTSLGEAILWKAGAITTLGNVTTGTAALTTLPEERERQGASVSTAVYGFDWQGRHLTLVDTPGDPNFQHDGQIALHALDAAVLVVSAVDGAKVGTERMWHSGRNLGLPMLAFVNGMDRERADFAAAVASLAKMDAKPVLLSIPIGSGANFAGVVDVLSMQALGDGGPADVPADLVAAAHEAHANLVEAVAECDDALLEKYLEAGELSADEMRDGLLAAVREAKLVPILAGSATRALGVETLLQALTTLLPSPVDARSWTATDLGSGSERTLAVAPDGPFAALVFKTVVDRFQGLLSVLRVVSGTLQHDTAILDATTGSRQRIGKLHLLRGHDHVEVPEAGPGDVVAVAKLKDVHTGHALTSEKGGVRLAQIPIPKGALSYAIAAKSKADEDKLFTSLARLVEEDPTLHVDRDPNTGQFLLTGMGDLHIRISAGRLKRMFNLEIDLSRPKIPYRETITRKVENVEGKLKKQTGGKGMYGVCYLSVEPLPRGAGFEFVDEIVGGSIPRNLIPAVEKGVLDGLPHGPLAGFPVVDIRVRCIDGKFHPVDSNEMAFKLAGAFGFKAATEQGRPTLLEPVMDVEVAIPDEYMGDIIGDLNSRRGRVQATESRGSGSIIKAQVAMSEMLEYASVLTSLTGGKGSFTMDFSHYEEVPAALCDKIVEEARAAATKAESHH